MGLSDRLKAALAGTTTWIVDESTTWRTARFSVVDLETTGLDLKRDEIVSAGVAEVANGRIGSHVFYEVARPSRVISEAAMCLHSLTADALAAAPPIAEVLERLWMEVTGSVIVAHAAWVERAFLNRALRQTGVRVPDRLIDTAALARYLGLADRAYREPSLEGLARRLELPVHPPHHALGDAVTTAQLFLVLATRIENQRGEVTVRELLNISAHHGN